MLNESKSLEKNYLNDETNNENYVSPVADIYATKDDYHLVLDMPGVSKENFKLKIDNDELSIIGKKSNGHKDFESLYNEIFYSGYNRVFVLPNDVNTDKIDANYENGVLKLFLHKKEEYKPKTIEIK